MKQIEVNGMIYEFDEKLLLKQEIRVGDNVQILIKDAHTPNLLSVMFFNLFYYTIYL